MAYEISLANPSDLSSILALSVETTLSDIQTRDLLHDPTDAKSHIDLARFLYRQSLENDAVYKLCETTTKRMLGCLILENLSPETFEFSWCRPELLPNCLTKPECIEIMRARLRYGQRQMSSNNLRWFIKHIAIPPNGWTQTIALELIGHIGRYVRGDILACIPPRTSLNDAFRNSGWLDRGMCFPMASASLFQVSSIQFSARVWVRLGSDDAVPEGDGGGGGGAGKEGVDFRNASSSSGPKPMDSPTLGSG